MTARLLVTHWQFDPGPTVLAALAAGVYVWAALFRVRRWPLWRTLSFVAGIGCVLVALESGIAAWDERLLSAHMVQHMLLLMAAPLLLLAGRPLILALRALAPPGRARVMAALTRLRALTRPVLCLAIFYAVVLLTHLPGFYDAALSHPVLHDTEHLLYVSAGLLLLWPLLDGDPVPAHRLGGFGRLVYTLAAMPVMALIGAYLNQHSGVIYAPYGPGSLSDQAQAGSIMWTGGDLFMAAVGLWSVMSAMVAAERRQQAREKFGAAL